MVYHKWDPKEYGEASLIMHGHTDYGTLTLLPSQPVSCLQMLNADNEWRWVGYEPGSLLVNLGDALDVISGGQFKATRHKVECSSVVPTIHHHGGSPFFLTTLSVGFQSPSHRGTR